MPLKWRTIETKGNPIGRHETAFIEYGGKFYLIGGREANGCINQFDPRTNQWQRMNAKTPLIHHFQPVVRDRKIIMVGAMTGDYPTEPPLPKVQIYTPETDKWTEGGIIPETRRRGSSGVALYNGRIYIVGGITHGHTSGTNNWFDEYDIETDTWVKLPDAPLPRDHFHAVVVKDKLYCIGGRNTSIHEPDNFEAFFGAVIRDIDVYDFLTNRWETLSESSRLPVGSAAGGVAHLDGNIIYFGGENDKEALADTRAFDIDTNSWISLGPLNQGRHGSQAIVFEGKIYVAAGSPVRGGGNIDSIEVLS